jgi:hypothetical protein
MVSVHSRSSKLAEVLQRERRLSQRPYGQPQEQERVVIGRRPVEMDFGAGQAPVDQDPFAVAANGYGDRLHGRAAACRSVPGHVVV